jgi:ferritin
MTAQFLLQFLEIQRKSIGEYGDLLARLQIADDNAAALLMIDNELGQ